MTTDTLSVRLSRSGDIITGETSTCIHCHAEIRAVVDTYSGIVDWETLNRRGHGAGDYGCGAHPLSDRDGTHGHDPGEGHTPLGTHTRPPALRGRRR